MNECTYGDCEPVEMAIKALEQEPCEDAISRQAVVNAIANTCFWLSADDWKELMECISSLPSITPAQKWIPCSEKIVCHCEEQEHIFDKIIEDIQTLRGCSCWCSDGIIDDVEDIIDKYRAESEE